MRKFYGIQPRVDRFFYGSRYGKRASSPPEDIGSADVMTSDDKPWTLNHLQGAFKYYNDRIKQLSSGNEDFENNQKYNTNSGRIEPFRVVSRHLELNN